MMPTTCATTKSASSDARRQRIVRTNVIDLILRQTGACDCDSHATLQNYLSPSGPAVCAPSIMRRPALALNKDFAAARLRRLIREKNHDEKLYSSAGSGWPLLREPDGSGSTTEILHTTVPRRLYSLRQSSYAGGMQDQLRHLREPLSEITKQTIQARTRPHNPG